MLLESLPNLLLDAVPHVPLDRGVMDVKTGVMILDLLPLITMIPCLPVLRLFWSRRRYGDFVLFTLGFLLAILYHIAHLGGLENTSLFNLPGSLWRSLDILCAQTVLSRTLGHAVGAHTSIVSLIYNSVFPCLLIGWAFLSKRAQGWPPLTFGAASKALFLVMLSGLAAKVAFEGATTFPLYAKQRGKKALLFFFLGFVCFPLPELYPSLYCIAHSLWHCFLAAGYSLLYEELTESRQQAALETKRKQAALKKVERLKSLKISTVVAARKLPLFLPVPISMRSKAA
ncbi:hypothetical protein Ndes2526B_g07852 [Nannochloris sp. 'desiccata']|nr:hypothetical protein KSW81_002512 [Chlorella desiccata (nom. nud.)]KAH7617252.1 hypothetical protein NADE_007038 [Chlorella desiccata (nom. nud.)]